MVSKRDLERAKRDHDVKFLLGIVQTNPDMEKEDRDYLVEILDRPLRAHHRSDQCGAAVQYA